MTELAGAFWLIAGLGALTTAAVLAASFLRLRSAVEFVLAAYAIGWFWLVIVMLGLSPLRLVTRGWLVGALASGLAVALVAWLSCGRPQPPPLRPALRSLSTIHPAVLVLGVAVLLGLVYSIALALFTPVNEGDSLAYHLARVAFWKQEQQIGYVPGAVDLRLDVSPPNAEIGQLATVLLSGGDRYVALPQLLAYVALVFGVAGIARRVGFDASESLFGALLFASLPVVVVQASGALNDLVVASFLTIAALFAIHCGRRSLVVFALALGLALGTKVTAVLALPTLALVAAVARPRREWPALALAGIGGLAAGAAWYVVNLLETGELDGGLGEAADQRVDLSVSAIAVNAMRFGLDLLDMSGAPERSSRLFVTVALALVLAAAVFWRRSRRVGTLLLATSALSLIPLATPYAAELGREFVFRGWVVLGRPPTPDFERGWGLNVAANPTDSWYGPLGLPLLAAGSILVAVLWRRRRLPPAALGLSLAPWLLLLTLAVSIIWDSTRGRFLVFGVALAAATWGALLRWPITAAAIPALAVAWMALSLVNHHSKPSGVGTIVDGTNQFGLSVRSIWGAKRAEAQTLTRGDPEEAAVIAFVEDQVPADATIALAPRENDFLSPYFGPRLTRTVVLLTPSIVVPANAEWLVLSPSGRARRCTEAWQRALVLETGWRIERRVGPDACPAPLVSVSGGPG